jgi:heme exporter protein A
MPFKHDSPAPGGAAPTQGIGRPLRLEARALCCVRNDQTLFRSLDLAVAAGEVLLIGGANGSGKTSLLRLLAGLGAPESGTVRWCGADIATLGAEFRAAVEYVGHANGIKLDLSAAENLEFTASLRGTRNGAAVAAALDEAGLSGLGETRARLLSAGQRRRLALARLRLSGAPLWLLDEPLTALDAGGRGFVADLIGEHARRGGVAVVATHESPVPQSAGVKQIAL